VSLLPSSTVSATILWCSQLLPFVRRSVVPLTPLVGKLKGRIRPPNRYFLCQEIRDSRQKDAFLQRTHRCWSGQEQYRLSQALIFCAKARACYAIFANLPHTPTGLLKMNENRIAISSLQESSATISLPSLPNPCIFRIKQGNDRGMKLGRCYIIPHPLIAFIPVLLGWGIRGLRGSIIRNIFCKRFYAHTALLLAYSGNALFHIRNARVGEQRHSS